MNTEPKDEVETEKHPLPPEQEPVKAIPPEPTPLPQIFPPTD